MPPQPPIAPGKTQEIAGTRHNRGHGVHQLYLRPAGEFWERAQEAATPKGPNYVVL